MTAQAAIQSALTATGIPAREIKVYGSQIMIECASLEAAERFAAVVAKFATVRRVWQSWTEAKRNTNTMLKPSMVKVWMVAGKI